jgi:hypothetical protein
MRDEFEARAVFVREAPTVPKGNNYRMAANSELRFDSVAPPYHRKTIFITNRHATINLFVRVLNPGQEANSATPYNDPTGDLSNNCITIWHGTTQEIPTSGSLLIRNVTDSAVETQILEIFYT